MFEYELICESKLPTKRETAFGRREKLRSVDLMRRCGIDTHEVHRYVSLRKHVAVYSIRVLVVVVDAIHSNMYPNFCTCLPNTTRIVYLTHRRLALVRDAHRSAVDSIGTLKNAFMELFNNNSLFYLSIFHSPYPPIHGNIKLTNGGWPRRNKH